MDTPNPLLRLLEQLAIPYELVHHPAVFTTAEADRYIEGINGVRTVTLLVTDRRKKRLLLLIYDDSKRLDLKALGTQLNIKGIKMASTEQLWNALQCTPGTVSPFGLIHDADCAVSVLIDTAIQHEARMSFHPNTNEQTLFLATDDLLRFLAHINHEPNWLPLPQQTRPLDA